MTVALAVFSPLVAPEVPGCPVVRIRKAILDTAIEFCTRTSIWLDTQSYPSYATQGTYNFQLAPHTVVHQLRYCSVGNQQVEIRTREWCDMNFPGWRPGAVPTLSGSPEAVTQFDTTSFRLVPTPTATATVVLEVALKPKRTATLLPDFLYEEYEECISAGALARLLMIKGAAWYSPTDAAPKAAYFEESVKKANLRQSKAFSRARLRVTARFL